jgi:hypothetical protein
MPKPTSSFASRRAPRLSGCLPIGTPGL